MSPARAALVLTRRFGSLAVLARGAGLWSVILMRDARYGSGTTITEPCRTVGQAVSQALQFAMEVPGIYRMGMKAARCSLVV